MERSILVIDDNADIRENTAEILQLAGYRTITAVNGRQGVELAMKEQPSVIVCDIMMPELDGYGVLHLLRKNSTTQHIPFIFLTAKTERIDFRKGMEMGADDYITKPFDDIELLNAVEIRLKRDGILKETYQSSQEGMSRFLNDMKSAGLMQKLAERCETLTYRKKQMLYTEGRRPHYLYGLLSGKAKGYRSGEEGKEYITNLYSTGDFIGYAALIEDRNYDDSCCLIEDAEVMQIPREEFLQMIHGDRAIASKFIRIITQDVKEKEDRLISLAYGSLRKRVARALVEVVVKFGLQEGTSPLEVSREELAQYVGTATESLIRTLSDFKSEGLIDIRSGKVIVKSLDRLKNLLY